MTKLVVGLGNPGRQYATTRHNIGWVVLDALAAKHGCRIDRSGFDGVAGEMRWGTTGEKVYLLKPLTYMNLSGRCVVPFARFYKIDPSDMIVIYDEMDLPAGRLRLRDAGSAGGHNGMKSLIGELGSHDFPRLRIGVGRPAPGWDVVSWLLSPMSSDEAATIAAAVPRAVEAVETFLTEDLRKAMDRYNREPAE